jgi:hypothetical protein
MELITWVSKLFERHYRLETKPGVYLIVLHSVIQAPEPGILKIAGAFPGILVGAESEVACRKRFAVVIVPALVYIVDK